MSPNAAPRRMARKVTGALNAKTGKADSPMTITITKDLRSLAHSCQRAVVAIAAERHAITEHQSADDRANRIPHAIKVGGLETVVKPDGDCQMCPDNRRADGEAHILIRLSSDE